MDIIEIDKDLIPYYFEISLNGELFVLDVSYNENCDMFTIGLLRDNVVLCIAESVVYGVPLFQDIKNNAFPSVTIIPLDLSGETDTVTYDNLGDTVFLYVYGVRDDEN